MSEADTNTDTVGYGRPPRETRFKPGRSGNPRGRPRNRHREIPYDAILGQMVTLREEGRERRITAAEAFILKLAQKGLAGDSAAARSSLTAIEAAREKRVTHSTGIARLVVTFVGMGISTIMGELGIALKKHARDEHRVQWLLRPWIVEAALERLGSRQLSIDEQREVWANTLTPEKVQWPEWWSVRGDCFAPMAVIQGPLVGAAERTVCYASRLIGRGVR